MERSSLITREQVVASLDAQRGGWKGDREGWVTLSLSGVKWRVHYHRGELLEVGWWGTLEKPATSARHRARRIA